MISSAYRNAVFALYQFAVALGILLMPLAVAVRKLGVPMPVHRVVETLDRAYERANSETSA
ncbi:MAG: hypothetical protein V5A23_05235 [Halobacteriales archaeon]